MTRNYHRKRQQTSKKCAIITHQGLASGSTCSCSKRQTCWRAPLKTPASRPWSTSKHSTANFVPLIHVVQSTSYNYTCSMQPATASRRCRKIKTFSFPKPKCPTVSTKPQYFEIKVSSRIPLFTALANSLLNWPSLSKRSRKVFGISS